MKPIAAEERAGEIGAQMAKSMVAKLRETINGFPDSGPEQRAAIASLVAEGMEDFASELVHE